MLAVRFGELRDQGGTHGAHQGITQAQGDRHYPTEIAQRMLLEIQNKPVALLINQTQERGLNT